MEKIPVIDQGDFPFCYSFSATQMQQAYTASHPPGSSPIPMSPVLNAIDAAAASYQRGTTFAENFLGAKPYELGGGSVCFAANHTRSQGACQSTYSNRRGIQRLTQDINTLRERYKNEKFNRTALGKLQNKTQTLFGNKPEISEAERTFGYLCDPTYVNGLTLFKDNEEIASLTLAMVESAFNSENVYEFLMKTLFPYCSDPTKRIKPTVPECKYTAALTPSQALKKIHQQLSKPNPQPIEIGYCSRVLSAGRNYNGSSRIIDFGKDIPKRTWDTVKPFKGGISTSHCGLHSSLVIGRRKNPRTGICQLLVRDSRGTSCDPYSTDWNCDFGNIWVDEEILAQSIFTTSYLE